MLISYICYNHFGGDYIQKAVKGICPVLNKAVDISINYIDASTFEGKCYVKGTSSCNYRNQGLCKEKKCPVYENAPNNL